MKDHRDGLVLVTGAGSGVGGALVRRLAASDFTVLANFRTATPTVLELEGLVGVTFLQGDLMAPSTLAAIPSSVRAVVHSAAVLRRSNVSELVEGNVVATQGLLRHVQTESCRAWIQLSTVSVHGDVAGGVLSNETGFVNPSCYGLTKRLAEQLLEQASGVEHVHCLRLPSVLAPGAQGHWLARVVASALRGEPIVVSNPSSLFNNTIHVDDLCSHVIRLLSGRESGYDAYPLASSAPVSLIDIVREVVAKTGSGSEISSGEDSPGPFLIDDSYARATYCYESRMTMSAVSSFVDQTLDAEEWLARGSGG